MQLSINVYIIIIIIIMIIIVITTIIYVIDVIKNKKNQLINFFIRITQTTINDFREVIAYQLIYFKKIIVSYYPYTCKYNI
jgi:hypothetical protein